MSNKTKSDAYRNAQQQIAEAKQDDAAELDLGGLDLSDEELESLIPEIASLTALQELHLDNNQLKTFPAEIASLTALQELDVSNNQLTTLPAEIASLTALQMLDLRFNQLTTLPPEIASLTALTELYLHGNPDLGIPPEILGPVWLDAGEPKPPREILDYYFTHRQAAEEKGTEPLMEAKVLVLGEAKVGKTCLIAAFSEGKKRNEVPDGGTSGIVRKHWKIDVDSGTITHDPKSPSAEKLRLNCWDFGGQEIYHSAHTLFLTERAIYLIVISKRGNEHQNNADYWLKMAASFGGPDAVTYLVVNQTGEKVGHFPDEEALRRRHPHLRGVLYTSCDDLSGVPELRTTLVEEALRLKGVRLPVPRNWLKIKTQLETMEEPTLSMQDWARLCGKDVTAEDAQRELLHLCDCLGTVRYFPAERNTCNQDDPPELCETAILNPEWVTLGIYAIFDDIALKKRGGLLNRKQMAGILEKRGYPAEQERIIEEVMRRFDLLYDSSEHGNKHRMLIPVMLPELEPAFDWPTEDTLAFAYQYSVMPAGLIPAFIARMHTYLTATPAPWRNGCVLDIKECRVRVIGDRQESYASISVDGPEPIRRDALDHVRAVFDTLHATVSELGETELIPVPGYPKAPMLDYKHMRSLEWNGIEKHHAPGEKPGDIIIVDVSEALDGVRGIERKLQDDRLRSDVRSMGKTVIVQGDYNEKGSKHMHDDHSTNIYGDIFNSQVGQTLTNCTNTINQQVPGEKKNLLEELRTQVEELIKSLPEDKKDEAPQIAKKLETLVDQATNAKPEREWYSLSAKGLLEASKWTKDFTGNILGTIGQIGKLLWPDYTP